MGLTALGCASESSGSASSCQDITGNYTVKIARISGTCDPAIDKTSEGTVSVQRDGDTYQVVIPGIEGGCPFNFDAASCKGTGACEFTGKDGQVAATASLEYHFDGKVLSGTSLYGLRPPIVSAACSANYSDNGSKL